MACVLALAVLLAAAPGLAHRKYHKGDAIYYSDELEGNGMACGGVYDGSLKTAAHQKLPCGTILRVKNLSNGERVRVTITDRGPFNADAILDVSRKAAKRLGFWGSGRTKVRAVVTYMPKESD
jgi:rare lipoprotein A